MFRIRGGSACRVLATTSMTVALIGACGDGKVRQISKGEAALVDDAASVVPIPPRGAAAPAWRAAVVAYGGALAFDTMTSATDSVTLVVGEDTTSVTFLPLSAAGLIPDSSLHLGWIIGKTISRGRNMPLGVPDGIGYVWVDSADGAWRATYIPENSADSLRIRPMIFGDKPFLGTERARVLYDRDAKILNWRCGSRCCIEGCPGPDCPDAAATRAIVKAMHEERSHRDP